MAKATDKAAEPAASGKTSEAPVAGKETPPKPTAEGASEQRDLEKGGVATLPMEKEIAARTVDNDGDADTLFHKIFAAGFPYNDGDWDTSGAYDHIANFASTVQDAINLGLRVTGDVEFDFAEPNPQSPETSTYMHYKCKVVPAHDVDGWTTSPSDVVEAESGVVADDMKAAEVRAIGKEASDATKDSERGPQRELHEHAAGAADENTPVKGD